MKKKNSTRIIAIVLVLLMALALIPIAASAAAPESGECTIIFDGNGGTTGGESPQTSTTQEYTMGETPALDANPFSREGYSFDGWNTQDDGLGDPVSADATVEALNSLAAWHGSTITLYAQWTPILTIVYATTVSGQDPVTRTYDAQCDALPTAGDLGFTNENHEFVKWHVEQNSQEPGAGDLYPASPVTAPTTYNLTTIWAHLYTVTFNVNGGSGSPAPSTQKDGYNVTFPADGAVTRTGYILKGWSENPNADPDNASALVDPSTYSKTEDVTLYAIWKQDRVPVTFANGSGGTKTGPTLLRGQSYQIPGSQFPDTAEKAFSHWRDEAHSKDYQVGDFLDWTSVGDAASVTLTAQWAAIQTVDFMPGPGATVKPASAASVGIPEGKKLSDKLSALPTAEMTDGSKVFEGWYTETNGAGTKITLDYVPTQSYTQVYANWDPIWTVTFDPGTGATASPSSVKVPNDKTLGDVITALPTASKTGGTATFDGWYTGPNGTGTKVELTYAPSASTTVYAKWVSNNVTFKFLPGTGASGTMADQTAARSSGKFTLPTASTFTKPASKCLSGWRIDTTDYALGAEYAIDGATPEEVTVTALWADEYTVTFNGNGGSPATTPVKVVDGGKVPESSFPTVTREGYTFLDWYVGDTTTKFDKDYEVTGNTTVKAKWLNNTVRVTFDPGTGSGTSKTQNMSRNTAGNLTALTELDFTAPEGSSFLGWSRTAGGAKQFDDQDSVTWNGTAETDANYCARPENTEQAGAVTLHALWQEKLTGTVTIGRDDVASISDPKVNDTLKAVPIITAPTPAGTLYYRWKLDGKEISGATGATYTVKPADYGKKISVEVSNDPKFEYLIKSSALTVGANAADLATLTVAFSGEPSGFTVKVNDTTVADGDTVSVVKDGLVKVTLTAGTSTKYVSMLQLGSTTLTGKNVAAVNNLKVPNEDTCTLTVTFADKTGTNKTATIDPNADVSATTAAITAKAKAGLPAGFKDRYFVNAFNVVPCWDNQVTNTLKIPDEIPPEGLSFTLPYPAGSNVNATVSANMPGYYNITVYHKKADGTLEAIPDARVSKGKAFASGVTVTGQKDFSDFGVAVTPNKLDGSVLIKGKNADDTAAIGAPLTAEYKDGTTAHVGTLSYQWQVKNGETWTDISGDAAKAATFTPTDTSYNGKQIRCKVTSSFEYGSVESNPVTVVSKPNPSLVRYIVRGHNEFPGVVGNVTSDMEYTRTSSNSAPGNSATWTPITSTTFSTWDSGYYWVRFKNEASTVSNPPVYVPLYYTVTAEPDSVSTNRLYFTASGDTGVIERVANKEWLVPEGKNINVTATSANTTYYKITQINRQNNDTGVVTTKSVNKANSGQTGSFKADAPYYVWASAGVYGSKTGDTSHLDLWIELAALSMMGLGAALVIGRKKLKEQK